MTVDNTSNILFISFAMDMKLEPYIATCDNIALLMQNASWYYLAFKLMHEISSESTEEIISECIVSFSEHRVL